MLGAIAKTVKQLIDAGGSLVGVRNGTEEPAYSVERLTDGLEIRHYGQRIAAETTVHADEVSARNAGFRRLAGYIFGDNQSSTKIAMTAPVVQQAGGQGGEKIAMTAPVSQEAGADGEWVIRFFMPANKTLETLPKPNDTAVRLFTIPAQTVAVRRFSGSRDHGAIASQTAELISALRDDGFEPIGTPAAWFYDPPWTVPVMRRNEIAVAIEPAP
jgi:hypothetical protein